MTRFEQAILQQPRRELSERERLQAIIAAYDRALADPKTVIPTLLHAAIEAARRG